MTRSRSLMGGLLGLVFGLAFGAVFIGAGLWVRSGTQPLEDGVIVVGMVVDVDQRTDSDGDRTYSPIVDYVDPETGQTRRLGGSVSSSSRPEIGSTRDVSLRPGDPSSARVVGPAWFPWIFIVSGAGVIVVVSVASVKKLTGLGGGGQTKHERRRSSGEGEHVFTIEPGRPSGPASPGFHPDPENKRQLRYWDGSQWTDDFAPVLFDE